MLNVLNDLRLNRIVRTLEDELKITAPLTFLNRVPTGTVFDNDEILAEYSNPIYAADIIMNDSEARVVSGGKITANRYLNNVPNIKTGTSITQSQLQKLAELSNAIKGSARDNASARLLQFEQEAAFNLVSGIRATMNMLCAAMYQDSTVYDRFGVDLGGTSNFGTPVDLKTVLSGANQWTAANLATFDAIDALQQAVVYAGVTYGKVYNRVDMATSKFQLIIQSAKFQDKVRAWTGLQAGQSTGLSPYNISQSKALFEAISGLQLNLEDGTYITQLDNGAASSNTRVLIEDNVLLSDSRDDGNKSKMDFALGVPDELTVSKIAGNPMKIDSNQSGILSYYESTTNPPNATAWAVVKGYPRKKDKYINSVIKVS